jgi:hypothetical protein
MCYNHFKQSDGVIVAEMDYSKRYQSIPMHEIQSEFFGKDADVSMEICILLLQDKDMSQQVVSYSHVSNENHTDSSNYIPKYNRYAERS